MRGLAVLVAIAGAIAMTAAVGCIPTPPGPTPRAPVASPSAPSNPAPTASVAEPTVEERFNAVIEHTSDPNTRADAEFRLAVILSERERNKAGSDLAARLARPISILRKASRETPDYPHLFALEYELAHDLADAGRLTESVQVFRSLACRNHFAYPVPNDPKDSERDSLVPVPQDHPESFWRAWESKHNAPSSVLHPSSDPNLEERFRDPYASCSPLGGDKDAAALSAEVWLQIGQVDFDMLMPEAGPYALNRATSAFERAIASATEKGSGATQTTLAMARYKLAWSYYKQQRYQSAVGMFVAVLQINAGKDFDDEATTYIAGSLTQLDLVGPAADEPFITRPDVLDTEHDAHKAEMKMAIALSRVAMPQLIPQDRPWTPAVYVALAREYRELNQLDNAIAAYELLLKKWPLDDLALQARFDVGTIWLILSRIAKGPTNARTKANAVFAAVKLDGAPGGAWNTAHRDDAKAQASAAALVAGAESMLDAP